MTSHLPVRIATSAARAIASATAWWATNRPKAPDAFVVDLENALKLIASHPGIGAKSRSTRLSDVRRAHLARVHYHLYYRVTPEPAIEVLALWHTSREEPREL